MTLDDYETDANEVSTITTFATEQEAQAFIAEEKKVRGLMDQ